MKENLTSINVVMDRSSSMAPLTAETITAFNKFVAEQKLVEGECLFTLCTFNHQHEFVHNCVALSEVPELTDKTYTPSGFTALLDALGTTIDSVGARLSAMQEDERPSKVLFLVITDGEENSSRKYTKEKIKSMVEHQTQKYSWNFVFIGAGIDAFAEGTSLGFSGQNSVSYTASDVGTDQLYSSISANASTFRSRKAVSASYNFFQDANVKPDVDASVQTDVSPVKEGDDSVQD